MKRAMKALLAASAAALLLTQPLSAQNVERSAPTATALNNATPLPQDVAYPGGTMRLDIDATDTQRRLYRVTQTIPVAPGTQTLTLLLPEWLPGNHAPRGTINLLADIRFEVNGQPVAWRRNPFDVFQFDLDLPTGAREVVARFIHTSPITGSEGRVTMTPEMLNLQWEKMSLYPAGYYTRRVPVEASVTVPEGWRVFTALEGQTAQAGRISWAATDYETLVDSPIFAGKHHAEWDLGRAVDLGAVADRPELLKLAPENLAKLRRMVTESDALFGSRPFDEYTFLLAMTDRMGGIGLEHHRSSENQWEPDSLVKWDEGDWDHNVLAHELVHAWNGKYRRPEGLWAPDYRTPTDDTLLWMYEGQTQFWGWIIAARSGLQKKETILGALANAAANYSEGQPGRAWRSVEDTTYDPIINSRRPLPYSSLTRSEDYYVEGALTWLEADQIIRQGTKGRRGLDDFAKAFFGGRNGDWGVRTYDFAEIVRTLNAVYPYDWASFLDTRVRRPGQPVPMRGIEMAGYRLVWRDTPNPQEAGAMNYAKNLNLFYSLGVNLNSAGNVVATRWDGPAFNAGIVNGAQIMAVNGTAYSATAMKDAITAAKGGTAPIQLLVKRGDQLETVPLSYTGGLRYPWLEPVAKGTQGLDRLLAPRAR
jgi:predicted metalloprotease with PDZ domain